MATTKKKERLADLLIAALDEGIDAIRSGKPIRRYTIEIPDAPKSFSAAQVKKIREKLKYSQSILAAYLGVSTKAVQAWEQGTREPNGAARRMLELLSNSPEVVEVVKEALLNKSRKKKTA